jgi:glutamyl-tRNA reductase
MIELCARISRRSIPASHFCESHANPARSSSLERFLGRVISLNDLPRQLALHDIVVCSTAAPLPLIGKGLVESALKARKHRPMLMFDLAVPRDIEAEVGALDDVFLYTVDDLGKIAREGLDIRENAVAQAKSSSRITSPNSCIGSGAAKPFPRYVPCATPPSARVATSSSVRSGDWRAAKTHSACSTSYRAR